MVDYTADASSDVIAFLWTKLQAAGVMDPVDYEFQEFGLGIVPIIPVQEQPELANRLGDLPYIIYDVTTDTPKGDQWWILRDQILFTIYCPDYGKIREIRNLMIDLFRKKDDSARALNSAFPSSKFNYHCVYLVDSNITGETRYEQGRMNGEVLISYDYVRYLDSSGNFA